MTNNFQKKFAEESIKYIFIVKFRCLDFGKDISKYGAISQTLKVLINEVLCLGKPLKPVVFYFFFFYRCAYHAEKRTNSCLSPNPVAVNTKWSSKHRRCVVKLEANQLTRSCRLLYFLVLF